MATCLEFKPGVHYIGISACFFCHDGKGQFLMGKRSPNARDEQGRWDIGSEEVEFGETLAEALQRGIKEEYRARVIEFQPLGNREVFRENCGQITQITHWIVFDFKVLIDSKKVRNGAPKKLTEIQWFRRNELPEKLHSQLPKFLCLYGNSL